MFLLRSLKHYPFPHALLVAISHNRDGGHDVADLLQIAFGQFNLDRADVFLQAWSRAAARNRNDPRFLCEQPGQRDLCGRRLDLGSDLGQQVYNHLIRFDSLRGEARIATAQIRTIKGGVFVDLACLLLIKNAFGDGNG